MIRWSIFFLFLSITSAENPLWKCDKAKEPPILTLDLDKVVGQWHIIHRAYYTEAIGRWGCEKKQGKLINDKSTVQFINPLAGNRNLYKEDWNIDKTNGNNFWINKDSQVVAGVWLVTNRTLALSLCYPASDGEEERIENEIYTSYRIVDNPRLEKVRNELKEAKIPLNEDVKFSDNKNCHLAWEIWDHPILAKSIINFSNWLFSPYLTEEYDDN